MVLERERVPGLEQEESDPQIRQDSCQQPGTETTVPGRANHRGVK